ncbi:MAG: 2-amino-4-hydroxy-6-hydroxymethyldihydropteridine diphosphokinase [Phycisphaerae bacterium]|nr:2-amino-4-hydroxy-6-hydroxymethyldihydropteridine diphosphokinase [Phycisphaerae bacterium]
MNEHTAYIGLGSNAGDRRDYFNRVLSALQTCPSVHSIRESSFYETAALGPVEQPAFFNGALELQTSFTHRQLFELLGKIEQDLGRQRSEHWGPRTIDLDLLLYDDSIMNDADLKIPHPQLHLRSFALKGLYELAPDLEHPVLKRTMRELAGRLNGGDYWLDSEKPQLISIAGNIGVGKTTLATGLAERLEAKLISEKYDANPFLADVYAGKTELALDSELFFLSSSASQLRKDRMKAGRVYVNDYVFEKAHIYASGWLEPADLAKYEKHFNSICEGVTNPRLVIYLNDSVEHCLQRIHQRNRPYEQQIKPAFLEHLARGYDTLYTDYTVCPVIRLSSDECRTPEQVDRIAEEAKYYIAKSQG